MMVWSAQRPIGLVAEALSSCRGAVTGVGATSLIINLLILTGPFSGPLFMMQVYDRGLASGSIPMLVSLSFLVGSLYAFFGTLEVLRARIPGLPNQARSHDAAAV